VRGPSEDRAGLFRRSCSRRVSRADYDTDPARRVLWAQFENQLRPAGRSKDDDNYRKGNELAVAKVLLDDKTIAGPVTYEPDFCRMGARSTRCGPRRDNLYVEVKRAASNGRYRRSVAEIYRPQKHHPRCNFIVEKEWMGRRYFGNVFASRAHFLDYTREFETRLAAAKAIKPGPGVLGFAGRASMAQSNLEDFADFFLPATHRGDDAFALMELHHIKEKKIELLRNIDHFAWLRRHIESTKGRVALSIRPTLIIPPPRPLEPSGH